MNTCRHCLAHAQPWATIISGLESKVLNKKIVNRFFAFSKSGVLYCFSYGGSIFGDLVNHFFCLDLGFPNVISQPSAPLAPRARIPVQHSAAQCNAVQHNLVEVAVHGDIAM